MLIKNLRSHLRWIKPTPGINSKEFLVNWEKEFGSRHDPSPLEVVNRFKMLSGQLLEAGTNSEGQSFGLAEIGAGYGRISEVLIAEGFNVCLIEPNLHLFGLLETKFPDQQVFNSSARNLPELPVEAYFSCRALEYCGLVELFVALRKLKKLGIPLICWERPSAGKRVRLAARISGNSQVFTQDLLR